MGVVHNASSADRARRATRPAHEGRPHPRELIFDGNYLGGHMPESLDGPLPDGATRRDRAFAR